MIDLTIIFAYLSAGKISPQKIYGKSSNGESVGYFVGSSEVHH